MVPAMMAFALVGRPPPAGVGYALGMATVLSFVTLTGAEPSVLRAGAVGDDAHPAVRDGR